MPVRNDFKPGEFCWIDLNAHDLEAATAWYGKLFDWTAVAQDTHGGPPYAFLMKGGAAAAGIGQMSEEMKAQGIPPLWNSYIHVEDSSGISGSISRFCSIPFTLKVAIANPLDACLDSNRRYWIGTGYPDSDVWMKNIAGQYPHQHEILPLVRRALSAICSPGKAEKPRYRADS